MPPERVFTVSELNTTARVLLEQQLGSVWVQGEVSGLTRAPSGHLYFTLKDDRSELSAVRFKSRVSLLSPTTIEPGTVVLAQGTLTVYEPRGRYQLVVSTLQPVGEGSLQRAFEALKRKLSEEGLFAPEVKRPLPRLPRTIGVITSSQGAALRDVLSVLARRWPAVHVYLFPSSVQGETAPDELRAALHRAIRFSDQHQPLDVLLLTRGGGSAEDLAAFNDERLARALYDCRIPIVSAVGHEIDFSICDFVADHRAPTPSAAAEIVVPERSELLADLRQTSFRLRQLIRSQHEQQRKMLLHRKDVLLAHGPKRHVERGQQRLDWSLHALLRSISSAWRRKAETARHAHEILRLSDPSLPLQRGFSLTYRRGETRPLREVREVDPGTWIETRLIDGTVLSRVEEATPDEA
jgi:exodeoxyribonuclease VII large subunit